MRSLLLPLLALVLAGCTTGPAAVTSGAKLATVATLVTMEADEGDAQSVRSIALTLHLATEPGELPDLNVLRAEIMQRLYQQFSGRREILLVLLADEIAALVLSHMEVETPGEEITILVHAAASGIVYGCDIYIAAIALE